MVSRRRRHTESGVEPRSVTRHHPGSDTLPTWSDEQIGRWVRTLAAVDYAESGDLRAPVPDESVSPLLMQVIGERLEGLLIYAIRKGLVEVANNRIDAIVALHRSEMERALRMEKIALDVSEALSSRGVDHVFLKGTALAHSTYPDASMRLSADVDVLVAPEDTVDGLAILIKSLGATRPLPELRPGFDSKYGKDMPLLIDGVTVDFHRTLIRGPFGERIPTGDLVARRQLVSIGGCRLPVLDPGDAYVHAALTAGAGDVPARLVTLRDMLELESASAFSAELAVERAQAWGVEAALQRATNVLAYELRPDREPALSAWADRYVASRPDRFFLSCYTGSARSYRTTAATLLVLPGWRNRLQFTRALLFPQRSYRLARSRTRISHLTLSLRRFLR